MNERLKQLADQVGAVQNVLAMGRHDGVLFTETELKKFVELIVRECVDVVKWTPSMFPNDTIIKNIKEHFGVEE